MCAPLDSSPQLNPRQVAPGPSDTAVKNGIKMLESFDIHLLVLVCRGRVRLGYQQMSLLIREGGREGEGEENNQTIEAALGWF